MSTRLAPASWSRWIPARPTTGEVRAGLRILREGATKVRLMALDMRAATEPGRVAGPNGSPWPVSTAACSRGRSGRASSAATTRRCAAPSAGWSRRAWLPRRSHPASTASAGSAGSTDARCAVLPIVVRAGHRSSCPSPVQGPMSCYPRSIAKSRPAFGTRVGLLFL